MTDQKRIWEMPPREPIPRQENPGRENDHPERQSEGTTDTRHKKDGKRTPKRSPMGS